MTFWCLYCCYSQQETTMTQVQAWDECKVLISYVYAYEAAVPSMAQGYPNAASRDQALISSVINRWKLTIFYFTVVTWPTSTSKAGGDLALIQTPLLFSLKYQLVSMIITWFTQQKQWSLDQTKVTCSHWTVCWQ